MQTKHTLTLFTAALGMIAAPSLARAAFLDNTDFETEPLGTGSSTFPGWSENGSEGAAATDAPTPIAGAHSAKLVAVSAGSLHQSVNDPDDVLTAYTFEVSFAANDSGGSSNRSFHLNLRHGGGLDQINLRVVDIDDDGDGDVQLFQGTVFQGGAWVTVDELSDSVVFSANDSSLSVNHLRIVADYAAAGGPSYDIFVTDANGQTRAALGRTEFQDDAPTSASTLELVSFETGSYNSAAFTVIDDVSLVPEPASLTLLTGAGLMLLARRRRR